ncbi:hypothetical protein ACSLBF_05365 [Pseudoalteromonas sp. T1lg65]|uniref:hypothetical protein n=1 Tax=Pseudoalteromonas sp. T1lg65 TaxID=2077101 RepID=UPI003F7B04C9
MKANTNLDESIEFINQYELPVDVIDYFDWHVESQFKQRLSLDEIKIIVEGLKDYFIYILLSPKKVAAASKLVDELFHCFILHTQDYMDFCDGVGRYIHHFPIQKKKVKGHLTNTKDIEFNEHYQSIIRTYCIACQASELDPLTTDITPYFFRIDSILREEFATSFDIKFFQSALQKLDMNDFILEE